MIPFCVKCGKPIEPNPYQDMGPMCSCPSDPVRISDAVPYLTCQMAESDKQQIRAIIAEEIAKVLSVEKIADEVVKKIALNMKMQGGSRGW